MSYWLDVIHDNNKSLMRRLKLCKQRDYSGVNTVDFKGFRHEKRSDEYELKQLILIFSFNVFLILA